MSSIDGIYAVTVVQQRRARVRASEAGARRLSETLGATCHVEPMLPHTLAATAAG